MNYNAYYWFLQLGVVLLEQGKPSQALAYLERALELEPDHQASLLNSAIVLQEMAANDKDHDVTSASFINPISFKKNNVYSCHFQVATEAEIGETNAEVTQWRRREATKRLKRLLQLDPQNERALFNMGMLAMDNGDMPAAEHNFKVVYPVIISKKT